MAVEWQRVANTTIHKYIREEEVNILRDRKFLAMLESRGRLEFNGSGDLLDFKVRYKRAPMRTFTEMDTLTFARVNRWKTAQLDWKGYAETDSINKLEKLKNKGQEAIIKVYSQMGENLMDDIRENFADELWINGTTAANAGRLHGLESMFGTATAAVASVGFVGVTTQTYAGLVTTLGNYGGSWSLNASSVANWPNGKGDAEYDFWTPLVVDYTDSGSPPTGWASNTKTWPNTCGEAIRYGISKSARAKSKKGMLDMILLDRELYRQLKEFEETKERLVVRSGEKKGLYQLGFLDVINIDGVDVSAEYGMPDGVGYGINVDQMKLVSLQESLFDADIPDFDIASQMDRFAIFFFGQAMFNPKFFVKWAAVT